ncbi:hypothetical protein [Thiomicrorhabdus aquaedulcis]|uniref:hypothetical protein n=1 Tax=Thiomicrorhabdus aquaedulcis TaxID=2211106 RepID=UPI000FDC2D14|nr:hypothetical protein [Thiomicrorhabdus aquaedulcis]
MGININFKSVEFSKSFPALTRVEFNELIESKIGFNVGSVDGIGKVEEFHSWRKLYDLINWMFRHLDLETFPSVARFQVTLNDVDALSEAIEEDTFFTGQNNAHEDDIGFWKSDVRRAIEKARFRLKKGAVVYLEVA